MATWWTKQHLTTISLLLVLVLAAMERHSTLLNLGSKPQLLKQQMSVAPVLTEAVFPPRHC